jgi:hypothetical protein
MRRTASPHPHTAIVKAYSLIAISFSSTSKQAFGSARSRAGSQKFKVSKNFLIID